MYSNQNGAGDYLARGVLLMTRHNYLYIRPAIFTSDPVPDLSPVLGRRLSFPYLPASLTLGCDSVFSRRGLAFCILRK